MLDVGIRLANFYGLFSKFTDVVRQWCAIIHLILLTKRNYAYHTIKSLNLYGACTAGMGNKQVMQQVKGLILQAMLWALHGLLLRFEKHSTLKVFLNLPLWSNRLLKLLQQQRRRPRSPSNFPMRNIQSVVEVCPYTKYSLFSHSSSTSCIKHHAIRLLYMLADMKCVND